jgi:hypothetical protein
VVPEWGVCRPLRFEQRSDVTVGLRATETDICPDRRSAEISVEDRLGRLQMHSLIGAIEQLAQTLDCAG